MPEPEPVALAVAVLPPVNMALRAWSLRFCLTRSTSSAPPVIFSFLPDTNPVSSDWNSSGRFLRSFSRCFSFAAIAFMRRSASTDALRTRVADLMAGNPVHIGSGATIGEGAQLMSERNVSSLLIIDAALGVSGAILAETSLSFFGLGIQAPDVSLGTLLQDGNSAAVSRPWLFIFPAAFLVTLLTSVALMGDALRDALDPTSGTTRN